jgi:hypothetical protein
MNLVKCQNDLYFRTEGVQTNVAPRRCLGRTFRGQRWPFAGAIQGRGDAFPAKVQTGLGGPSMAGSGAAGRGRQWSGQGPRVATATATSLILPPAGLLGAREFGGGRGSGARCRVHRGERGVLLAARNGVLAAAAKGEL